MTSRSPTLIRIEKPLRHSAKSRRSSRPTLLDPRLNAQFKQAATPWGLMRHNQGFE